MSRRPPSFDLVVATVERTDQLGRFLDSVEAQGYPGARVLVIDQNQDGRLADVVNRAGLDVVHLHAQRGLSRARNASLGALTADLVAFPDDDCAYPPHLLELVARRFAADPALDGLTIRAEDATGRSSSSWKVAHAVLSPDNLWNRANAATTFLRREVVERVGGFDERLGLGSGEPWSSGEEIDYLVRAIRGGARIEYEPTLTVLHSVRPDDARVGYRDGASVGYLLRKHDYPARVVVRMLIRPLGGAIFALLHLDVGRARFYVASFRGRLRGLRAATSSSKSSA